MYTMYQASVEGFESDCYSCEHECLMDLARKIAKAKGIFVTDVLMVDVQIKHWLM